MSRRGSPCVFLLYFPIRTFTERKSSPILHFVRGQAYVMLPGSSVVGGLVDKPVIGVPTSVGYGASFGGVAALLSMLNSCASGVAVVNIDNGFGASISRR